MLSEPIAKKVPFTHKYHEKSIPDQFHWLKDMSPTEKRPEIIEYLKQENEFAAQYLNPISQLRDDIYNEIIKLINEDDQKVPVFRAPYFYYSRTIKGKEYAIYCRRKLSMDSTEEILLNQNEMSHEYMSLGDIKASPDHNLLAYSMDYDGSEKLTISFKNLVTGELLTDELHNTDGSIEWGNDNQTIYYVTLDSIHRADKLMVHKLGTAEDKLLYHEEDEKFIVGMQSSNSLKYLFIYSNSSMTSEVRYLPLDDPDAELKLFMEREVGHDYSVEHQGNRFLIITNGKKKFLNYRLCRCSLDNTDINTWEEVLPYDPLVQIRDAVPFKDYIVLSTRTQGLKQIQVLPANNCVIDPKLDSYQIKFDEELFSADLYSRRAQNFESNVVRYSYSTPLAAEKVIDYNLTTKELKVLKEVSIPGNFDSSKYTMKRIFAPIPKELQVLAPFDTPVPDKIPISILYKTSLFKGDGTNPSLLYGYGSYGISLDLNWSPRIIPLLDRGFVYAIAHIRGGGDNGRAWYETGKFKHKKNTFHDFILSAKQLIAENYTSSENLAIEGRSAGGLLIGAVLNMEPSLAKVAVAGVPFVDVTSTMMDPSIPLTINEYEEWGNPNEQDYFDYMHSYSPYDNIPADAKFPDLLVKAGLFDPRVQYWEPAKWVAKLRAMKVTDSSQTSKRGLLLFDCKMGSGHFGSSGRYSYLKEIAADYAFIINRITK